MKEFYQNKYIKRSLLLMVIFIFGAFVFSACSQKAAEAGEQQITQEEAGNVTESEAGEDIADARTEQEYNSGHNSASVEHSEEESVMKEEETMQAPTLLFQGHGSLRIVTAEDKVIYIDPYAGDGYDLPADLILITHSHFDHKQTNLIEGQNEDCRIITQKDALADGTHQSFDLGYVKVEAVEAGYNKNHDVKKCVGYVLGFSNGVKVYVSGDTSKTPQMENLEEIDYAFFCCDGVYNMDTAEASECAELVGATHSIPYHMIPADPQNNFDQTVAESFEAEGRIIMRPGDELKLEK